MILITKYAMWAMLGATLVAGFCGATALYNWHQRGSKALIGYDMILALIGAGIVAFNLLHYTS